MDQTLHQEDNRRKTGAATSNPIEDGGNETTQVSQASSQVGARAAGGIAHEHEPEELRRQMTRRPRPSRLLVGLLAAGLFNREFSREAEGGTDAA